MSLFNIYVSSGDFKKRRTDRHYCNFSATKAVLDHSLSRGDILDCIKLTSIHSTQHNFTVSFWWFDEFLHFFTPLVLTLALALRLYDNGLAEIREHKLVLALTVACVGVTAATLWEIMEWTFDQFVAANAILGKTDTIVDLILGTAGAVVAGVVIIKVSRPSGG